MRSRRGYTLSELAVAVSVIIVLIGMALPSLTGMRQSAHDAAARESVMNSYKTAKANWNSERVYPALPELLAQMSADNPSLQFVSGALPDTRDPRTVYVTLSTSRMVVTMCATSRSGRAWCLQATEPGAPGVPRIIIPDPPDNGPANSVSIPFQLLGTVYETTCSLDGAAPVACASPFEAAGLALGPHQLRIVATGPAGTDEVTLSWTRT